MSDHGSPAESGRNPEARGHLSRVSRAIKPAIETRSYIAYLFREYVRVREFGRRTHVLLAGVWPPGVTLDPELTAFLVRQVQGWAADLSPRLKPVLDNGWLHLTPRQYNLVVVLKRLSDRLSAFDFSRLSLGDRNLIDRLRRIESLFLMLQYNPENMGVILSSLRVYFEKQQQPQEEIEATGNLVIRLLTEDCTLPSLYNCILGFNIFKHRRFLAMCDLMREGLGEIVNVVGFDCDEQVLKRIETYVSDAVSSMKELHGQLQEARRVNRYIAVDDQERPLTAALWDVYKAGETREPADFDADQENLVPFLSRLVRGFDRVFAPLLNGSCVLESGRTSIFSRSFFELELTRLRSLAGKLEKDVFALTSFPLHRYLRLRKAPLSAVGNEGEVTDLIAESVGCMVDIGQMLSKVLALRSAASAGGVGVSASPEPLQPLILRGKPFTLPHENERFPAGSRQAGKTVVEALSAATSVCFTAGMLFQDDFVMLFIGKERKLEGDLRQRMTLIEHLLDPEKHREVAGLLTDQ
ncbi:MAG: hypothetical protein ABSG17_02835 [Spirochaetia bacterium]